ncbi:MAG TPA: pyrroloquinoline quinone precursor peptide PqqA [Paenirhodobacter sp.]
MRLDQNCGSMTHRRTRSRIRSPIFNQRRNRMAWITPKYFDTPVGMEINMYACADEK